MEKISIPDPFRQEQGCGVGLLYDLLELRVGVAQVPVSVDEGFIVRAPLFHEVEQTAHGQIIDILRAHNFLLVSVPTDVQQSSNRGWPCKHDHHVVQRVTAGWRRGAPAKLGSRLRGNDGYASTRRDARRLTPAAPVR